MVQTAQLRDIVSAVEATGGSARVLDRDEIAERWIALCEGLGGNGRGPGTWLWEWVKPTVVRPIPNDGTVHSVVGKLVGARRCLMFFTDRVKVLWPNDPGYLGLSCVELEGEASVTAAIGETYGSTEVYVADPSHSWVVILNHEEQLIGVGDARAWVEATGLDGYSARR
jgi:hypothetical protein